MRWIPRVLGAVLIVAVLAAPAAALVWEGTLVDEGTGTPIGQTEIVFVNQETREEFTGRTDPEGHFRVEVTEGSYRCRVQEPTGSYKSWRCGTALALTEGKLTATGYDHDDYTAAE